MDVPADLHVQEIRKAGLNRAFLESMPDRRSEDETKPSVKAWDTLCGMAKGSIGGLFTGTGQRTVHIGGH